MNTEKQYRTRNGQPIQVITPTQRRSVPDDIGNFVDQIRVQILPPVPQRLEWVNESNIVEVK